MSDIHTLDIAVVGLLLLSAVVAWSRGFVREVLSLASWIGAVLVTIYTFELVQPYVRQIITIELFANAATAVGLFTLALIVFGIIGGRIARAVGQSGHGAVDKSLGFLFGLVRGGLLVAVAYLVVSWVIPWDEQPPWLRDARTTPLIREAAAEIEKLLPENLGLEGRRAVDRAEHRSREAAEADRLLRRLNAPTPTTAGPAPSEDRPGYTDQERRDLERLIRGTQ
ncbi:MAG: CvpA family protein [Alphaproteobacteria bacterium]